MTKLPANETRSLFSYELRAMEKDDLLMVLATDAVFMV
jgi:hypothetical protein